MPKKETELKLTVTRSYSEGRKLNIGNYESRDFFSSAGFSMELPADVEEVVIREVGLKLQQDAEREVAKVLDEHVGDAKAERDGKPKPERKPAPSVPGAFATEHERNFPGKKFVPRAVTEEEEYELGAEELDQALS